MARLFSIFLLTICLASCQSNPPAPVVNKSPQAKKTSATNKTSKIRNNDWRPNTYIVKQGDTLYSIGLAHGYYYKDIAAANNINDPYLINVGQQLDFSSLKTKDNTNTSNIPNENGVVLSPVDISSPDSEQITSVVTPILSEPKAVREPYSLEALNRHTSSNTKPAEAATKIPSAAPTTTKPTPTTVATTTVSSSGWSWPTVGKITSRFNPTRNKGIDIAGKKGQAIKAAAPGKVIYTGSDLRGYGKLVIIKHNKTFLSVYAHNSKIVTKEGQAVKAGQKIAEMGDSDTNATKLHFEIRKQGKSIDPAQYLPQN